MKMRVFCLISLAFATISGFAATRAFFDDFESYAVGSNLHGQGGWTGWANNTNAGALVSTNFAFSPTRSVNIAGASDLVHTFSGATNGPWVFSVMQYIPSTSTGTTAVILMNKYRPPYGTNDLNWSVQIRNNMDTGQIISDLGGGASLPMVKDQWVEIRCEIDLTANSVSEFYNGQLLSTHAWQGGLGGPGLNEIQALDLFANNAAPVYYDNVRLDLLQSYTIPINAGLNLIANQLDHGSNRVAEIMPTVPNGCVLYKYENASGTWKVASFFDVWTELPAAITLSPGEGAFLQSPTNFTLTFTGTPHVPVLPVSIPVGAMYLLSRQTNDIGTYENIVGAVPTNGSTIYRWTGFGYGTYAAYTFSGGTWSPAAPSMGVGEAVWIGPLTNRLPPTPPAFQAYTLNLPNDGRSALIANQLDHGSNTLDEVVANVPDGTTLYKWDCTIQGWSSTVYTFSAAQGRWSPNGTLAPGEGALITLGGTGPNPYPLVFTGTPHVPVLPATLPCGHDAATLLSRQTNDVGTFENITGLTPTDGSLMALWNEANQSFDNYSFSSCTWSPGVPSVAVGGAALITVASPVAGPPQILSGPADQTVCSGGSATFSVCVSGSPPLSYQWEENGIPIAGATGASYTLSNAQPSSAGPYAVKVTNPFGPATSPSANLSVTDQCPPAIAQQPVSLTVTQGQSATFSVAASGTPPLAYTWHVNCGASDPNYPDCLCPMCPASASITLSNIQPSQAGDYYVVVSSSSGSVTSTFATLTVVPILSYTVDVQSGFYLIANQLDHGSNTLAEVMPSPPDGTVFSKFYQNNGPLLQSTYSAADGFWSQPELTLNPGEGAFLQSPMSFSLTFTGTPHVPVLPVSIPAGATYLVSRQTNDVGTFENIVGLPPADGARVYKWTASGYQMFEFAFGAWSPAAPSAAVGEALWIQPAGGSGPASLPQSYTVNLSPGLNLIANQLDHGSNTLNVVLPSAPDGSALYKRNNSSSPSWTISTYSAASGKWLNGDTITLSPGEAAFLQSPSAFTLIFTGTPHVPVLPVSIPAGQAYLVSRQTNDIGTYQSIVGTPPPDGALVYEWNGSGYTVFMADSGSPTGWSDSIGNLVPEPIIHVGGALWISPSGSGTLAGPPSSTGLTVITPAAGGSLCSGSTMTITWSGGNPAWNVYISLADVSSWAAYTTITPSTPNTGSFTWTIPPGVPASTYLVYIQEVSGLSWTYGGNFHIGPCPTNTCVPPPSGLGLWLPLDETTGTGSANLFAGGNPGTRVNSPTVISGYVANSLSFNGANQYVKVLDYPAIDPGAGQDFSIDAWVKRASNAPNSLPSIIVDKRDPTTFIGYSLALSYGNLIFQMCDAPYNYNNYRDTGVIPPDNQWHLVAVTVTRNLTNGGRFYIDGVPQSTFNPTGHPGSLASTAPFQVAASPISGNRPWLGALDEVEFFQRALLPSEVQAIYQAGSAGKCKCLPPPANMGLWLPLDETTGTTSANLAPSSNSGTHINAPAFMSGYVANSLAFNGVNQYVTVPDYAAIDPGAGQNFSIDAWVRRSANSPNSPPSVIVDKRDANTGLGYSLALSYGNLIFQLNGGGSSYSNYRDTGTIPPDNKWHLVAVTLIRNQTNGGQFYIDGVPKSTFDPTPYAGISLATSAPFQVAASGYSFGNVPWMGGIDEVEFFQRALTAQEVLSIFNAGAAGKCKTNCAGGLVLTCSTNKTVECGSTWTFDAPTASSCCGTNITLTFSTVSNGACPQVITRTWTVSDLCGNTNTCTQTVTVVDTTPPAFGLPGDKTVECGTAWIFDPPQVLDACCGTNVTLVVVSTVTNGTAPCSLVITRTWRATDCCGNSATNHQTVTVRDTTPPVFATSCVTNFIFAGGGNNFTTPVASSPSAGLLARLHKAGITQFKGFDQCIVNTYFAHTFTNLPHCITAATLTVRLKPCGDYCLNDTIGLSFTSASGVLQTNGSWGSYLGSGNPSAGLDSDNWCNHTSGQTFVLNLAALPGTGANLLAQLNANGYLDFTCQDDTGVDYLQLNVTSCCYQPNKTVECGSQWTFDTPTATDTCCGNNVTVSVFSTVTNGICPKVAMRTWKATDCCGNSSFFSQNVTMVDTTPPVVYCPGPITRYTCSNSAAVYYSVWAYDACSGYRPVTCTPPSGHVFPVGTTIVSCTATDACGNVGTCSFTVTVVNQTIYASTMLGVPDCFKLPTEAAPKSAQLLAAHPGVCWKPFDDLTVNCDFGASFMDLPANITCGQLWIRMKPNCNDIPENDSITIGLNTNNTSGWSSYIGGGNASPGLTTSTWCGQGGCGQLFNMNLASMPNGGANLLPLINAAGSHKLDLFVQDDTGVDFAQLSYCYCRALPWWYGWEWNLANAGLSVGQNFASVSPLWSPGSGSNFSLTLAPGATHGIQIGLVPLNLGAIPNASLTVSAQTTLDPSASAITITGDGSNTMNIALSAVRPGVTQVQLVFRLAGTVVFQETLPATIGSNVVSVLGGASMAALTATDTRALTATDDLIMVTLDGPYDIKCPLCPPMVADEVDVVLPNPSGTAEDLLSSLTLAASGLSELQLSSAAAQVSGLYPQVTGDAVASAGGDQLTITPSDPTSTNGMGFQIAVPASQAGASGFGLQVSQNLNAPPTESNGVVSAVITGQVGADMLPAIQISAAQTSGGWALSADFSPLGTTSLRIAIKEAGVKVTELAWTGTPHVPVLPASWTVSADPAAPSVTLSWPEAQTITVGGTNYTGDEMQIIAVSPDLPFSAITAMQIQASGVDALTLSSIGPPALVWVLQPPLITPSQMTIQWSGPAGGTLESAPSVLGPWTPVPGQGSNSAVLASPLTNGVPTQFFRVRTN